MTKLPFAILVGWLIATSVFADVPSSIPFQGYLTTAAGTPLNESTDISVSYWGDEVDNSQDSYLYAETYFNVAVEQGLFNLALGLGAPDIPGEDFDPEIFGGAVWLELKVNNETLTPRRSVTSSAYALRAQTAESLPSNTVMSNQVVDNSLTSNDIADNSLTGNDIQNGTISYLDIANASRPSTNVVAITLIIQQSAPRLMNNVQLNHTVSGTAIVNTTVTATLSAGQGVVCWQDQDNFPSTSNIARARAPSMEGMTVPLSLTGRVTYSANTIVNIRHFCQITDGDLFLSTENSRMTVTFLPGGS